MESPLTNMLKPGDINGQMQLTLALQALITANGDVSTLTLELRERFGFPPQGKIDESTLNNVLGKLGQGTDSLMGEIEKIGGLRQYLSALQISTPTKR